MFVIATDGVIPNRALLYNFVPHRDTLLVAVKLYSQLAQEAPRVAQYQDRQVEQQAGDRQAGIVAKAT